MSVPWNLRCGVVILGDSAVGKSSLLHRYTEGTFDESRQSPLGIDFKVHHLTFDPGVIVKLLLWDTAGQERFRSISKSYMRNSVGCILVFDLSRYATFERVRTWHREVLEYVSPAPMVFLLVGHKSDVGDHREVTESEGETLARVLKMAAYLEVSSKENMNVSLAFETLTREIYRQYVNGRIPYRDGWYGLTTGTPIVTPAEPEPQQKKAACCS